MKMAAKLSDETPELRPSVAAVRSLLATKQLVVDRLIPYIALYSRRSSCVGPLATNAGKSDRTTILKWFSSLSVTSRLSYITIVDHSFAQLLLQMLSRLRSLGHCTFFILPDLPESGGDIPSLCHRRSRGLIARIAHSNEPERLLRDSVRLFSSNEGESVRDCGCSSDCINTVTFTEEFVKDVDRFLEITDMVSDGGFLMSDWDEMGADIVEFGWFKAQGYSSMEAFVVNRMEVALRSAWLSCNPGKKRGGKLKEKVSRVGVAVNVYGRKMGCVDWWEKLDASVKRKLLRMFFGKMKFLVGDIFRGADRPLDAEKLRSGEGARKYLRCNLDAFFVSSRNSAEFSSVEALASYSGGSASLPFDIKNLVALLGIISPTITSIHDDYDKEKLFFSSVDSVNTIWDCILRKLRGVLMIVSLESTKLELLEDGVMKVPSERTRKKTGGSSCRKKGKNHGLKKPDAVSKSHVNNVTVKDFQDVDRGQGFRGNLEFSRCNNVAAVIPQSDLNVVEVDPSKGLAVQKVPVAERKNRKEKRRKKHSDRRLIAPNDIQSHLPVRDRDVPCEESSNLIFDQSTSVSSRVDKQEMLSFSSRMSYGGSLEEENFSRVSVDEFFASGESNVVPCCGCDPSRSTTRDSEGLGAKRGSVNYMVDSSEIPREKRGEKLGDGANNFGSCGDTDIRSREVQILNLCKGIQENKDEVFPMHEEKIMSINNGDPISSGYPSYEWPSLAPLRSASSNLQHHPPATDRLNLEIGHTWSKRFQQSSMQQMHKVSNPQIDSGHGKALLQSLSMSLDWPPGVRNANGLTSSLIGNYDPGFGARKLFASPQGFTMPSADFRAGTGGEERKIVDLSDPTMTQEATDEVDGHWISEEECEVRTMSCLDYNQYFGGGVMYWNPSDYREAGLSRPPSLSSDDSSWAWREADMNRTVDEMVAFSSYNTNGLASPSTASFCSPFEASGKGHHAHCYVRPGNEVSGKLLKAGSTDLETTEEGVADADAKSLDLLPYPLLRPIIVPSLSRERSRSEFKSNHELRSPCIQPSIREQPRIKRPPSPVVLCVPRSPRPPPPSLGDARKYRGCATVRSGSSSPRHWGVRGWFLEGNNFDEASVCMDGAEMVWPSRGTHQLVQPLVEALLQDQLIAISQLTHDQEHPDARFPLQPLELLNCPSRMASLPLIHKLLHDEIDYFCKQVASENLIRRPYINWAVKRVTRSLQVLWPRSRTSIFGSNATGLSLPTSDVDLVVCLPPVRNLEPIKEAGILEGRNGIKETCLQHAARYLANQEWVKADSVKTVENTAIPIIMLVVEVPIDLISVPTPQTPRGRMELSGEDGSSDKYITDPDSSAPFHSDDNNDGKDAKSIRLDISFKSMTHTGLQTAELVKQLTEQFPASVPLALVLKQFLSDRSLDQSYSGGLSSYCLVLLIIRFLQHEHHHGKPNQNLGSIFMDFLYFFGNVFDPRRMRVSIQGSGLYVNRERGHSIDPIYIDDPLFPTNNVGKNCFRIHQCIKAFSDAYSTLENEITCLTDHGSVCGRPLYQLLPKIIPSIGGT